MKRFKKSGVIDKIVGASFILLCFIALPFVISLLISPIHILFKIPLLFLLPLFLFILHIGFKLVIYSEVNKTNSRVLLKIYANTMNRLTVSFSGIDGSGKSTQLYMLNKMLKSLGFKTRLSWMRWPAFTVYPFLLLGRLLGLSKKKGIYGEPMYHQNKVIARLIALFLIFDYISKYLGLKLLQRLFRASLLLDRNIIDLVADLYVATRDPLLFSPRFINLYQGLLRGCRVVVLDVDEEEALERKADVPNLPYLRIRRRIYYILSRHLGLSVISTTGNEPTTTLTLSLNKLGLESFLELYRLHIISIRNI